MVEGDRRLAAIMFTDIEGYTALTQRNESLALQILQTHKSIIRPLIEKHRGHEVKTMGDAFLVEFASALEATECAVEIQDALQSYNQGSTAPIRLKIGIHVGDVVHSGGDVYGDAVNIASRIEPLALGGGVCLSEQVYYQVRNKIPHDLVKLEVGSMKNVDYPTAVYRLVLPWEKAVHARESNRRRMAVLPFDNISPDPSDGFFADGLTEELTAVLSKVQGLEVIARTSVMRYKGGMKQVSVIGEELKVGAILEGSVRKAGNKLRITSQLIDTHTQAHIWSDIYDTQLDDIFVVQSEIANKVASALRLTLLGKERSSTHPTESVDAYTLYLKGHSHFDKLRKDSLFKAIGFYQTAIEKDPHFAQAYAHMAYAYCILGGFELVPPKEALSKAKEAAMQALELDETVAEAHVALGRVVRSLDWNLIGAETEFKRAIELDNNLAAAHTFLSSVYMSTGRVEEALAQASIAVALDPYSVSTCQLAGTNYLYARRHDEAIELLKRALELDPNLPFARDNLGLSYVGKGMFDEGIREIERSIELEPEDPQTRSDLAYVLAKKGDTEGARKVLGDLMAMRERKSGVAAAIGATYASLGDKDNAFEWLEKAFAEHSPYLGNIKSDFVFDSLRSDPRFGALEKRVGIPG